MDCRKDQVFLAGVPIIHLDEQISKHPDKEDFYEGVRKSEFFREFFEVGFVCGISWQEHNKNTKYVL